MVSAQLTTGFDTLNRKLVDYIVVGGGSAGCVVASRLSEDASVSVVLLEEGPRDISPYIHMPVAFYKTAQGGLLERYPWEPLPGHIGAPNPTMVQPRVLGGGSSVNAMVYIRGQRADYDAWEASGAVGWGYEEVMRYFLKCENNERFANEFHGVGGPLEIGDQKYTHPLSKVWLQACQQAGLPWNSDFNAGDQYGCGLYQEILRAEKEVILSAGAISSPKLLLLSGIGPAHELRAHGIGVVQDIPGVGRNLQDHIEVSLLSELNSAFSYDKYKKWYWQLSAGLQYLLFNSGPVTANIVEAGAFWKTSFSGGRPDAQFCFMPGAGIDEGVEGVPGGNGCTLNICQTRPKSVGSLALRSSDPMAMPVIRPNYLQEQVDIDAMAEAVAFGREIMHQPAMEKHVGREYVPHVSLRTLSEYREFVRKQAHAALHPTGTCKMGTDGMSVVSPDLKVLGVEGLRVIDNSVAPNLISGNTNSIAIMIGEKGADLVKGVVLERLTSIPHRRFEIAVR